VDASAPAKKGLPPALVAGGTAALAAGLALAVVLLTSEGQREPARAPAPAPASPSAPRIEQARWRVEARTAGRAGELSRPERRRLRGQRPRVGALVRELYDALFLRPGGARDAVRKALAPAAARSLLRMRRLGAPEAAERVRTLVRRARVAIEGPRGLRAVASVWVKARGRLRGRPFTLTHRATLWLERSGRAWRVIAYDVEQRPL
jgi:hypothetical protein